MAEHLEKQGFFGYKYYWPFRWDGRLYCYYAVCFVRKEFR